MRQLMEMWSSKSTLHSKRLFWSSTWAEYPMHGPPGNCAWSSLNSTASCIFGPVSSTAEIHPGFAGSPLLHQPCRHLQFRSAQGQGDRTVLLRYIHLFLKGLLV